MSLPKAGGYSPKSSDNLGRGARWNYGKVFFEACFLRKIILKPAVARNQEPA
jgi:hypothetical protein